MEHSREDKLVLNIKESQFKEIMIYFPKMMNENFNLFYYCYKLNRKYY